MMTNYKYDLSGAGCQRFDEEDYLQPPQDNIPPKAQFGLWNFDAGEWADEWYFNAGDAQDAADEMARSGGNLGVVSIDGWEYFNPSGFE